MIVCSDDRWPPGTGIGVVRQELASRAPADLMIRSLSVRASIGSPWSPLALGKALAGARGDVFWSAGFVPAFPCRLPSVVTIHDLTHLHYYSPLHVFYMNTVFKRLFRRTTTIICVSEFTRRELIDWSGADPSRIHVVRNGVSPVFSPGHASPSDPYVLYPGNRRSYKNLDRVLAAFARSRLPRDGVSLRFTGTPSAALLAKAQQLGCAASIGFLGQLDEERLADAYRQSLAIVFVSLYEGFGLPIVEGMASGVPVLTSIASAMPEVAGGAALLVDPHDVDAIAHGLERLVFDEAERNRLRELGLERAKRFSWESAAADTWRLVRLAAGHA